MDSNWTDIKEGCPCPLCGAPTIINTANNVTYYLECTEHPMTHWRSATPEEQRIYLERQQKTSDPEISSDKITEGKELPESEKFPE